MAKPMRSKSGQKQKYCPEYVGVSCINGQCPKAVAEEYPHGEIDAPRSCRECWLRGGCDDDCYFYRDGQCEINGMATN